MTDRFEWRRARPKRYHECCPNAVANLVGHRTQRGYNWKIKIEVPSVAVIYCPWCGVHLEEWRKLDDKPRLVGAAP